MAEQNGYHLVADYWRGIVKINEIHVERLSERVIRRLEGNLTHKTVAVLGMAFKEGVSDARDSPCIPMLQALSSAGAKLKIFDPQLTPEQIADTLKFEGLTYPGRDNSLICNDIWSACKGACVLLIFTDLDVLENAANRPNKIAPGRDSNELRLEGSQTTFSCFDWARLYESMVKPHLILDCWNRVDVDAVRELGFMLESVGKRSPETGGEISQSSPEHTDSTRDSNAQNLNVGMVFTDPVRKWLRPRRL